MPDSVTAISDNVASYGEGQALGAAGLLPGPSPIHPAVPHRRRRHPSPPIGRWVSCPARTCTLGLARRLTGVSLGGVGEEAEFLGFIPQCP